MPYQDPNQKGNDWEAARQMEEHNEARRRRLQEQPGLPDAYTWWLLGLLIAALIAFLVTFLAWRYPA